MSLVYKLAHTNTAVNNLIVPRKVSKTSNASHNIIKISTKYPIQYKFKKLLLNKVWLSGRSKSGSITVFSKGKALKNRIPFANYNFRQTSLFFFAGINFTNNFKNKLYSLIFNSTGEVSYVPTRVSDELFYLSKLSSLDKLYNSFLSELLTLKPFIKINSVQFLIIQQDKNTNVSLLEVKPLSGIQYTRSLGSKSKILKLDTRTGYSLVVLSSGLKKIFSIFSLSTSGSCNINFFKKTLSSTKSSDSLKRGLKPSVRGVAMNPIDHPHGGRTKSIKYQRTPWGKTTKYK